MREAKRGKPGVAMIALTDVKRACAIFVILGVSALRAIAIDRVPDADSSSAPKNKAIEFETREEGKEETWGVQSSTRQEYIYPSNYGEAGIFRVRSAESLPEGALTFGIGGEFFTTSYAPVFANFPGSNNASTIAETIFVGYAPARNLTISVARRNSSTTFGTPPQLISSLGDFNFSGMYSFPINDSFAVAPIADIQVASNFNDLAPVGETLSAGIGAAGTFSFYPSLNLPLFVHANLIYHMPQIRTNSQLVAPQPEAFFNFSRFDTITIGLGVEYKLGDFIPFLEYYETYQTEALLGFFANPSKVTIGTRFMPLSNKGLALLAGADIGTGQGLVAGGPYQPPYQIIGQVSYTFGLDSSERKHYFTSKDVKIVDRRFVIRKNINFKVGSAELDPSSTGLLDQIATVIKENNVRKLLIVGHTDSTAPEDYNVKLSLSRANTVKSYLIAHGVGEEVPMTQGYGKRKPKASNLTEAGRSLNRRVEFYIID